MSNLPGKITDPHLSARKNRSPSAVVSASFCKLPAAGLRLRSHHPELSEFYLFSISANPPDRICAILCAAAIFTCILTGKSKPSSSKGDTSAEK